ncbi:MAG: [ribosomal protein S5]-alanine N-acetyltransferase [Acidimicrobiaceae bacterium]|jgi:ribosomal-protein-alanine N-acetyltransferase|nr:[ribosomal protein S5]-alanine N-acetyltransferase [Acidimicrobiaceae bacterium]
MSWGAVRPSSLELVGRRLSLRPLTSGDFEQWREVRIRSRDWLVRWEPRPIIGQPDAAEDRRVFAARCGARDRERQLGTGYGFGIFVSGRFAGEINISSIQRGPFQNAYVGYWIDQAMAGNSYVPEAAVLVFRFAFEELALHRVQVAIIPRNHPSRRVAEKLGLREEGIAFRYLEINGVWEDHVRYAITSEDWWQKREEYTATWLS